MLKKYILIISFLLLPPMSVFANSFEYIGNTTNHADYVGGVYICNEPTALNFAGTSSDPSPCVFVPPTMFEVLVINSIIVAFWAMVSLIRMFTDNRVNKSEYL